MAGAHAELPLDFAAAVQLQQLLKLQLAHGISGCMGPVHVLLLAKGWNNDVCSHSGQEEASDTRMGSS